MGTTLTPTVEETVITTNHTVADIVKGLYEAEDTIEEGKELIRQGKRDLATFLALTPVLYEVSLGDVTVSGLLAMAGYQSADKTAPNYRDDQQ